MGNFNRSFNRDSRSGGGGRDFSRGSRDREMYRTTCSNCGKDCEVPFKPSGSKPVFCSDCFEKNGGGQPRRFEGADRDQRRSNFGPSRSFDRPQYNDRPRYEDRPQPTNRPQEGNDQFASLNAKLDRIITLLTPKPEYQNEPAPPAALSEKPVLTAEKKARAPKKPKAVLVETAE